MKKIVLFVILLFIVFSCKSSFKGFNTGNFTLVNNSNKVVEFVYIAPEGEFYGTSKNVNIEKGQSYEENGLEAKIYDIAIDFKDEFNTFNSKKDKSLCLSIEKGITKTWVIDESGNINRE